MPLIQLIYVSTATAMFVPGDLVDILAASRKNNPAANITGLLLFRDGTFIQALEGPDEAVDHLSQTIRSDPRHQSVTTMLRSPLNARTFGGWAMAFEQADALGEPDREALDQVLTDVTANTFTERQQRRLEGLLRSFRQILGES